MLPNIALGWGTYHAPFGKAVKHEGGKGANVAGFVYTNIEYLVVGR